ncbi:anti-sigma factor [Bacillus sp. JCM 19041]|uniref:anti-sigma factor n=1 Tax=Bacillus sp. JCM 19041 TaxID=1460637 RepID=UPI0006CF222A
MSKQCDQLIDYINGQLTDEETKAFEAHLETCSECQEELAELNMLTDDLGFITEPVEPESELKDRVLSAAFEQQAPVEAPQTTEPIQESTIHQKPKRNWVLPAMAAALFFSLIANVYSFNQLAGEPQVPTEPEPEIVVHSLEQQLSLQPGADLPFQATASLVNKNNQNDLIVQAENLTQTSEDQVYQVWLIRGDETHRAGTFTPTADGSGMSTFTFDPSMGYDTIAITIEPDATSETPQGEIVLSQEL